MSCSKDNDEEQSDNNYNRRNYSVYEQEMVDKLTGTSWKYDKKTRRGRDSSPFVLTFAQDEVGYVINLAIDEHTNITSELQWYFKDQELFMFPTSISGEDRGIFTGFFGASNVVKSVTSTSMILENEDGDLYFTKTSYQETPGGSSGNEGSSNGNVPYVIDFNYTATKTSITATFTCSERPTSASVKYGTTSANKTTGVSINGKQVKAIVGGLTAGTKYYFKCTVRNDYGSSTSDEWPAMTEY